MSKREKMARALASGLLKVCSPSLDKDIMEGTITDSDLRAFWVQGSINLFDIVDIFKDELREPDERMERSADLKTAGTAISGPLLRSLFRPIWQAMLDAIE